MRRDAESRPETVDAASSALDRAGIDHPVFAALPPETQARLTEAGTDVTLVAGAPVPSNALCFIIGGLIGVIPDPLDVCVAVSGAGSVVGLDAVCLTHPSQAGHALTDCDMFVVPADAVIACLGRARVVELCLHHTASRLQSMQVEAGCNALHSVPQRVAKWLLRLHRANHGGDLNLTQADLARLIGVQRTTVNVAARQLQVLGAARFARGKIVVQNPALLLQSACRCTA